MQRPKLSMGEWKVLHQLGASIAKHQRSKWQGEKMPQDEFFNLLYKTAKANAHLFPRGLPPGIEEFRKRDDGVIAQIEQPEKPGLEDEK